MMKGATASDVPGNLWPLVESPSLSSSSPAAVLFKHSDKRGFRHEASRGELFPLFAVKNFPTVLRLANKYLVSKVIHACEDFVLDPLKDFKKQKPDEVLTLLIASADHHLARPVVEKLVLRLASEDKAMFNRLKLSRMLPAQIYGAVIGTSLNLSQIREQETMNGHVYRTERNRTRWRRGACVHCRHITDAATCDICRTTLCETHTRIQPCPNDYGRRLLEEMRKNVVELDYKD